MKYRISLWFYSGPFIGDTCQREEFEAATDEEAIQRFTQLEDWSERKTLERIDVEEVTTQLQEMEGRVPEEEDDLEEDDLK